MTTFASSTQFTTLSIPPVIACESEQMGNLAQTLYLSLQLVIINEIDWADIIHFCCAYMQGDADSDQDFAVLVLIYLCQLHLLRHQLWPQILLLQYPRLALTVPAHPMVGKCPPALLHFSQIAMWSLLSLCVLNQSPEPVVVHASWSARGVPFLGGYVCTFVFSSTNAWLKVGAVVPFACPPLACVLTPNAM